jgi:hypothetical protein
MHFSEEIYFDKSSNIYGNYNPYVADLISQVSKQVLDPLAVKAKTEGYFLARWIGSHPPS